MTDTKEQTKRAFIISEFTDAGTGQFFEAGKVISDMPAGQFANYEHAGLVREADSGEAKKATHIASTATNPDA